MEKSRTLNLTALECIDRGVEEANAHNFAEARTYFEAAVEIAPQSVDAHSNLGSALQALNLHQEAVEAYSNGLTADPTHLVSRYCRAVSYSYLGEWGRAEADYSQVLIIEPEFILAYMGRGYVSRYLNNLNQAIEDFNQFLQKAGEEHGMLIAQVSQWKAEIENIPSAKDNTSIDDLFAQAMQEVETGNGMTAIAIYSEIIKQEPTSVEALANRANVYAALKDFRLALIDIHQAIELDPNIPILYFNRGNIYQDLGEKDKAITDYTKAIAMNPELAGAWVQMGKLKEAAQPGTGLKEIDHALELDPYHAECLLIRSRTYVGRKEYSLALNDLILAAEIDPGAPEIFDLLDDIIVFYDEQVKNKSKDPFAYISRAKVFQRIGRDQDALADWNYAVKLDSENSLLVHGRGNLYMDTEQFLHALADFERAIEIDDQNMDFFIDLASALISLGRPDEAMQHIDHAIDMDPSKPSSHFFRGTLNRMRALYQEAITDLSRAIKLGGDSSEVYYERGMSYLGVGQLAEAAADFEETLIREESAEVRYECGLTYLYLSKFDEAITHLNRAIELVPDYADALSERGWIYLQQGKSEDALADFNRAIHLQPDAFSPWAFRAELYLGLESWGEAIIDASRALLRDPDWATGHRIKGIAYFHLQKYQDAHTELRNYLRKALDISEEEQEEVEEIIIRCRSAF